MKSMIIEDDMAKYNSKPIAMTASTANLDGSTRKFMTKLLESTSSLLKSVKSNISENRSKRSFGPINELLYRMYLEPSEISRTCIHTLCAYRDLRDIVSAHPSVSLRGAMIAAVLKSEFDGIMFDEFMFSTITGGSKSEPGIIRNRMQCLNGPIERIIQMEQQKPIQVWLQSGRKITVEDNLRTLPEVGDELRAVFGINNSSNAAAALEYLR
jgi:hypothetical protein